MTKTRKMYVRSSRIRAKTRKQSRSRPKTPRKPTVKDIKFQKKTTGGCYIHG